MRILSPPSTYCTWSQGDPEKTNMKCFLIIYIFFMGHTYFYIIYTNSLANFTWLSFQQHLLAYDRGLLYFQLGSEGILRPGIAGWRWDEAKLDNVTMSHEKILAFLSIESWLFNRDPDFMVFLL